MEWERIKLMATDPNQPVKVREELIKALEILEAPRFNRTDLHFIKHAIRCLPFKNVSEDTDYIRLLKLLDEMLAFVPQLHVAAPANIKLEA